MATITNRVRSVLAHAPFARKSDKELYLIYMQKSGMNLTPDQIQIFREMPSLETIRRVRQKIQEGGEYLPDDETRRDRLFRAKAMKNAAPLGKPERIEETLSA